MAAQGSANQRLVALALLLPSSPPDVGAAAGDLLASGAGGEGLSAAALQVLLLSQSREDGVKTAIARLAARRRCGKSRCRIWPRARRHFR